MREIRPILEELVKRVEEDDIQKALERVIKKKNKKKSSKDTVKDFLNEVGFGKKSCDHPLVGEIVNWGTFSDKWVKKSEPYNKLSKKLTEILGKGLKTEYVIEVKTLLNDLRSQLIDYILVKEICGAEKGIRNIHAPGSVAKGEGMGYYFPGEEYTEDTLHWLAFRLCSSIALGDSLGIYSENESLMLKLNQLAVQKFGSKFRIKPRDLGIDRYEAAHPYAALLGLILWLMKELMVEEKSELKTLIQSILDELRASPICLFFLPSGRREQWKTIYLPRLDIFIERWILNEKARKMLEGLRDGLRKFIGVAERKGEESEVKNAIDLLMDNYDAFCRGLMEYSSLDLHAARRMMDIIVDLATKYGLSTHLRPLGSILSHVHPI